MRVLHLITDLGQGGAEAVSYGLIGATRGRCEHAVVSLHQAGVYGPRLRAAGVAVEALGIGRGRVGPDGFRRVRAAIQSYRPDVVQTRLYHADLLGGLAARYAGAPPVVWAVHSAYLGTLSATWKTRLVRRLCAWSSKHVPAAIVTDARSTAALHEALGYDAAKLVVIRNGVDSATFRPDGAAGADMRKQWGVGQEEVLIGCVARWDPLKDHNNLLAAIQILIERSVAFRCVLVGPGMTSANSELTRLIELHGVGDRLLLAGPSNDVPAAMNALDLHVLPSRAESSPVAVMEAMACGTPCVVTDVGDARDIVGDLGWIVPPRNSSALAHGVAVALGAVEGRRLAGGDEAGRARVICEFSLDRMAEEYLAVWKAAVAARRN